MLASYRGGDGKVKRKEGNAEGTREGKGKEM